MDSSQKCDQTEDMNESWVELNYQNNGNGNPGSTSGEASSSMHSIFTGNFEKLLIEAQRESRTPSQPNSTVSSRGSPKSLSSPCNEAVPDDVNGLAANTSDWIWDWSSRPEIQQPSNWNARFKHPRKPRLSVRNTRVMTKGLFCMDNLPTLLVTHACSFFLGAAMMLIYLKKYCQWTAVTSPGLDS